MNRKYNLKLDLQFRCNNSIMKFNQFDNNTSDFFMRITNGGNLVDVEKAIVVLAAIKPSGKVASQFVEVKNGLVYADLKPSMKDEIGTYAAQAMLILEDERVVTDVISYEVEEDKIFSLLNDTVETSEEFTLLTDMLSRLSTIEISEEQRIVNEAERILSEENRKIEEAKRVEAELIRQHEEADRSKYDATRESNENIRKQNESIRLANETNRIDEEAKRVEEENKRKLAEEERNANYNFMTEDEERRRLEANAHKEAEALRVQAETNRVNEEAKRRTTEQARVSAENTRVNNENTRKANETTRQTNEAKRVEAETQRQNRYNSFIADAEANANNFENYTNTAKVKEEERKSNELDRKSQEARRVSNEVERISNENTRKANEVVREKNEASRQYVFENKVDEVDKKIIEINATKDNFVSSINTKVDTKISELNTTKDNFVSSVNTKVDSKISELDNTKSDMATSINNKVNEVENRFNALTSKQQQDAEVIDARDGETSLKARLDRDIEKAKQVYVNVEGSNISTDSSDGYLKNVEILGNTIQSASNLADIRSVGDKVEGQELYEIPVLSSNAKIQKMDGTNPVKNTLLDIPKGSYIYELDENFNIISNFSGHQLSFLNNNFEQIDFFTMSKNPRQYAFTYPKKASYIKYASNNNVKYIAVIDELDLNYRFIEDKLTILSPVQLEKVGDVADRIIEKNGVCGIEKNVGELKLENLDKVSITTTDTTYRVYLGIGLNIKTPCNYGFGTSLCNMLPFVQGEYYTRDEEHYYLEDIGAVFLFIDKNKFDGTREGLNKYLEGKGYVIKYQLATPQFIPLAHDQQVKLRTFAGKTNISFGCEIEGTIKAQVPKSLGATVNTHTEQIRSLNNELNRVKKLEESTVSTVVTESDFTTVEATNNGYFEDVKLEGKTLVNLATQPTNNGSINHQYATISTVTNIKPSTVYTYIIRNNGSETLKLYLNTNGGFDWFDLDVEANSTVIGKARTLPTIEGDIWLSLSKAETVEQNLQVVLLEGDHTQNPPNGYIEGLKSVGQDVDEISVESVNENLWNPIINNTYSNAGFNCNANCINGVVTVLGTGNGSGEGCSDARFISVKLKPNTTYTFSYDSDADYGKTAGTDTVEVLIRDAKTLEWLHTSIPKSGVVFTTKSSGLIYVRFDVNKNNTTHSFYNIQIKEGDNVGVYTQSQQDKKRLLFYNNETQTWEKPILREWDSIEKHSDGKYYYHVRSKEGDYVEGDESLNDCITDLTVSVKKLAEEKVYECTNIDLITYANETNYIVECGAISPKTTLKVHNNISNVVSLLQKKVSLLESNMTKYMITQNRLMLASRYNADTVSFKVDVASFSDTFEYDNDLYELILNNILVGKDNYNREYIENLTRFYWMDFVISDEMYSTLFEIIEEQHNPKIEEETPLI